MNSKVLQQKWSREFLVAQEGFKQRLNFHGFYFSFSILPPLRCGRAQARAKGTGRHNYYGGGLNIRCGRLLLFLSSSYFYFRFTAAIIPPPIFGLLFLPQ